MKLSLAEARALVAAELQRAGAGAAMAESTARALVLAESQGLGSHGLSRVAQYATHLRNGRVNAAAQAKVLRRKGGALVVDAEEGLAFPACELAVREAVAMAREQGVVFAGVVRSHHCGVVVDHLRAPHGGLRCQLAGRHAAAVAGPVFGTNPVAAVFPRRNADALMIDLSLSEVARGKVMVAAKNGQPIPAGWALDAEGRPTTDAKAALAGSMLPLGAVSSPKGAMLALVVELLVTALIGANLFRGVELLRRRGQPARHRTGLVVVDPGALAGAAHYLDRIEVLVAEMLLDDGVRLPGARREALRRQAETEGIEVPDALVASWRKA
jgi:(2R)-3-sulfolactate dehydrogenase (NADP+)